MGTGGQVGVGGHQVGVVPSRGDGGAASGGTNHNAFGFTSPDFGLQFRGKREGSNLPLIHS